MGSCLAKPDVLVQNTIDTRKRRLSMSMDDEGILCDSPINACCVLTEPGVEFDRAKINQDAFYIDKERRVFAVLDGHGRNGHLCSQFFRDHLGAALDAEPEMTPDSVSRALVRVDDQLKVKADIDCSFSGTTVTCCLVMSQVIVAAWLGDTRAIMGRWKNTEISLVELSQDHKPDIPTERRRILKAGGRIRQIVDEKGNKSGGLRVFVPSQDIPGVNFTRSFGDSVIHAYGISSEVDCIVTKRTPADRFVVIASDGIYEFIDNLEVINLVATAKTVEAAAETLVRTAKTRWLSEEQSSDDVTAIVIRLDPAES